MDTHEQWPRHEEDINGSPVHVPPAINGSSSTRRNSTAQTPGYTLMVAGQRSGKTSFLRLLLDTSNLAPTVSKEQVTSVARFVQGCSRHTTNIRHASVDVILDSPESGVPQPVTLTLIDTPSLNFSDEAASQRVISDILAHIDSRFAESIDKESNGNHHVHLCIYFLDPEEIVPPSREAPAVPVPPRARTGSLSQAEQPIILEPPVATFSDLYRATLPDADINAIRRLSARVNVLPIVARADVLTNERLATIKLAIRNDLADAGIGFGIFDLDSFKNFQAPNDGTENLAPKANGDGKSAGTASPPPPATPSPVPPSLRLPYALISADIYAHSEGLSRIPPSRDDLVLQYTPSLTQTPISSSVKLTRGKFTRAFRWGTMDILDPNHCDFIHLRTAIFHHMRTLQKYTKEYLFEKFRMEVQAPHRQAPPTAAMHPPLPRPAHPSRPQLPLPRGTRPIAALDPPHPANVRHPSLAVGSASAPPGGEAMNHGVNPQAGSSSSKATGSNNKSQRTRSKKITVACNFCRSRKLKCDGGRPACGQCHKRSNPCDYIPHSKRRGAGRARKPQEDESGSEIDSGEDLEQDPAHSPDIRPISSRGNLAAENEVSSSARASTAPRRAVTQPEQGPRLSPVVQPHLSESAPPQYRPFPPNQDLPPIATLPVTPSTAANADNTSVLPPILIGDAHLQQPQQLGRPRKRSATTGSGGRGSRSHYASKIVACNFCRARKTRCDGEHPTCGACSRRSLACNYVNDGLSPTVVKRKSVGDSPEQERALLSPSSQSPPGSSSSHGLPLPNPSHSYGYGQHHNGADGEADMKRGPMDMDVDVNQPSKKMRFGG